MSLRQPSRPPVIEGYEFVSFLKSGGFADVFLYRKHGRTVAVKVLLRDLGGKQAAFEAEARAMATLSAHSSIVTIHDAGVAAGGAPYLIMEYCSRGDVARELESGPYAVDKALEIGVHIAGAIETAHRMGILHRDIKPANILFTPAGRPALTDFGISGSLAGDTEGPDAFSAQWAPPEQIAGEPAMTPASDVYSLAATMWTMLVGRSPFASTLGGNDHHSVARRVLTAPVPPTGASHVPDSLERVLATAMAKNPASRYHNAQEFARALNSVQYERRSTPTKLEILPDDDPYGAVDRRVAPLIPPVVPAAAGWPLVVPTALQGIGGEAALTTRGRIERDTHVASQAPPRATVAEPSPQTGGASDVGTPPTSRTGAMAIAVALVLALGGGVAYAVLSERDPGTTPRSSSTSSTSPPDAVGDSVAAPTNLSLSGSGAALTLTWTNPDPQDGDYYLVGVGDPKDEPQLVRTAETTIRIPAGKGRTCVEVQIVRRNGQGSDFSKECTS